MHRLNNAVAPRHMRGEVGKRVSKMSLVHTLVGRNFRVDKLKVIGQYRPLQVKDFWSACLKRMNRRPAITVLVSVCCHVES